MISYKGSRKFSKCKNFRQAKGQGKKNPSLPLSRGELHHVARAPRRSLRENSCHSPKIETGPDVENWPRNQPKAPPRQASFFSSFHCQFLVRTGKARSSSRPCKSRVIGAPATCQKRRSRDRTHAQPRAGRNARAWRAWGGPAF